MNRGLNERQTKFCLNYVKHGNAVKAYMEAGYDIKSEAGARASSSKLLTNPNVMLKLKELNEKTEKSTIADLVEIKEFWSKIVRSDEEETPHRLKAAELIAKTQGAFIDKVEHSGKIDINSIADRLRGKK